MERRGLAPATIERRFGTVTDSYKYAVLDGHVPTDPTLAVIRPRIAWEGQRRTVPHSPYPPNGVKAKSRTTSLPATRASDGEPVVSQLHEHPLLPRIPRCAPTSAVPG